MPYRIEDLREKRPDLRSVFAVIKEQPTVGRAMRVVFEFLAAGLLPNRDTSAADNGQPHPPKANKK